VVNDAKMHLAVEQPGDVRMRLPGVFVLTAFILPISSSDAIAQDARWWLVGELHGLGFPALKALAAQEQNWQTKVRNLTSKVKLAGSQRRLRNQILGGKQ
jgi:hypothetical protein